MTRKHAFRDDALGDLDAVALVEALASGRISVPEIVDAAIARAEAVNPALNGLAYEAFDRALARANAPRPYGGYFHGVPTFVKDNVAVEGMPTMQGTDAWNPVPAAANGDLARAFLSTGVIPLGKTQMSEFGFSGSAEHPRLGPVRNPWNVDHTAGASSSGSGAFVAAGVVPQADTGSATAGQGRAADAGSHRRQRRAHAIGARYRGIPPRDGAGTPQSQLAEDRGRHRTWSSTAPNCVVYQFDRTEG